MSVDVSVVVPVYNTEKYLKQCVDSLLKQTLKTVEFIFVDDGSTDRSLEILEEYRRKDDRIKILKQKNQYAGVARNNGMAIASGKYMIFLDSDDFFEPNMLKSAFQCAEKNQAEIVVFGFHFFDTQTGKKYAAQISLPEGVFSPAQADESFLKQCYAAPWNKLFLRSFIEKYDIKFEAVKRCNDTYFVQTSLILAERITFLNKRFVYYRTNTNNSQGDQKSSFKICVDCEIRVKKTAIAFNKYYGAIETALKQYMISFLAYSASFINQFENYSYCYSYIKENLIPNLFDDESDFRDDPFLNAIYRSHDFEEFLFLQVMAMTERIQTEYVSRNNIDYRVGRAMMLLPRRLKGFLNQYREAAK